MTESLPQRRFRVEDVDGKVTLYETVLVGRKASWCYYRSPDGAEEWRENGDHWHGSAEEALRRFITALFPSREGALAKTLCGGPTAEDNFRLMAQACVLLWRRWQRVRRPAGTEQEGERP